MWSTPRPSNRASPRCLTGWSSQRRSSRRSLLRRRRPSPPLAPCPGSSLWPTNRAASARPRRPSPCPPSLGLLTVNGLAAAGEVLVPIQCEYYALEGLGQLLKNVSLVQTNLNPRLELSAIVLTMYDARTRLAEQVAREVREHFGETVCRS